MMSRSSQVGSQLFSISMVAEPPMDGSLTCREGQVICRSMVPQRQDHERATVALRNTADAPWQPARDSEPPHTLLGARTKSPHSDPPRAWIDGNGQLQLSPGCLQDEVCRAEAADLAKQINDEYEAVHRGS